MPYLVGERGDGGDAAEAIENALKGRCAWSWGGELKPQFVQVCFNFEELALAYGLVRRPSAKYAVEQFFDAWVDGLEGPGGVGRQVAVGNGSIDI